ncbi:NADH dehydrogenase (ubiquinone) complex I, assembly factor 6 homolog [Musca vetustissima]|uniref:NADH dehydrogenase (ubiquinone) complex I, assembly factor 6 homolog n=1 Tax=Musca vetustissima TaxID=27455 RepID=UPI002AB7F258|nr:NADH dehydrogenase (ubiquinone) complex I, assembly factor 6 homolog [Musca vetustissima]
MSFCHASSGSASSTSKFRNAATSAGCVQSEFGDRNLQAILLQQQHRQQHGSTQQTNNGTSSVRYCMNLVEKNDHENYLCTLLLDNAHRRHAFALRAFNVEVAKCSANVSEDHIAKMRLKFWFDSIEKCYAKEKTYVADQPVLRELKNAIDSFQLNKVYLKRLVNARDRAPNEPFVTIKDLETYAEQTYSSLLYLLVQLTGVKDMNVDHAASHLGKAQGIVTLLRSVPYTKRSQALNIPQEVLIKNGVSQERVLRSKANDKGVEDCIFEVATAAHQHLEMARNLSDKVPKEVRKLFLPAVAIERYLERLRLANFNLTHQSCLQRDSMLPFSLYMRNLRGKF